MSLKVICLNTLVIAFLLLDSWTLKLGFYCAQSHLVHTLDSHVNIACICWQLDFLKPQVTLFALFSSHLWLAHSVELFIWGCTLLQRVHGFSQQMLPFEDSHHHSRKIFIVCELTQPACWVFIVAFICTVLIVDILILTNLVCLHLWNSFLTLIQHRESVFICS